MNQRPTIVCLCGSTRFKSEFEEAEKNLTLKGQIVLTVGLFGHADGIELTDGEKKGLDELHRRKIDLADYVLFINPQDYLGESTSRELAYAHIHNKPVSFTNPHEPGFWEKAEREVS